MNLVLLPGFMTDNSLWNEVLGELENSLGSLNVTYGNLNSGDSIEALAQHTLKMSPPEFTLIGFSMGGYVAREVARLAPDRVKSLILIGTSARADTQEQRLQRVTAAKNMTATNFRGLSQASIKYSVAPSREGDKELIEKIRLMGATLGKEAFIKQSAIHRQGDLDKLADIQCPTLIIAGALDRLRPLDEVEELHQRIPHSELRVIEDSGHMMPLEQASVLAHHLATWLK